MGRINYVGSTRSSDADAGNIGDIERINGADSVRYRTHGRVINRYCYHIARLAFVIEDGASFEIEGAADNLEGRCIHPSQRQDVTPECVIANIDIGNLDVRGSRGVLQE